ncbi:hypothetical protein G7009_12985 [Pseudomonas capeferrum]|uniref:hypothetical protein n=1 Tax=Pseudomonas capeferrum TaxID=1495066 RepID=UPI0015E3F068|nr:hypothetical protein [Pseudomonas capeferrum]MBA1202660.1 hypothetical protein [Pseudomonas capeferrum]
MEDRFEVVETNLLDDHGQPTGTIKYRIIDRKDPSQPNKHGFYEEKDEADALCSSLNAENPE